jgi:hypothetical protein
LAKSKNFLIFPLIVFQFFAFSETIFGYKSLQIKLYVAACTLDFYLQVKFEEKFAPKSLADPKVKLFEYSEFLPGIF